MGTALNTATVVAGTTVGLGLLELKTITAANFLPALVVAPLVAGVLHAVRLL